MGKIQGDGWSPAFPSIEHAVEVVGSRGVGVFFFLLIFFCRVRAGLFRGLKLPTDSSVGHHKKLQSYTWSIVTFRLVGQKKKQKKRKQIKSVQEHLRLTLTKIKYYRERYSLCTDAHSLHLSPPCCCCEAVCARGKGACPDRKWWEAATSDWPLLLFFFSVNNGSVRVKWRCWALVFSIGKKKKLL